MKEHNNAPVNKTARGERSGGVRGWGFVPSMGPLTVQDPVRAGVGPPFRGLKHDLHTRRFVASCTGLINIIKLLVRIYIRMRQLSGRCPPSSATSAASTGKT